MPGPTVDVATFTNFRNPRRLTINTCVRRYHSDDLNERVRKRQCAGIDIRTSAKEGARFEKVIIHVMVQKVKTFDQDVDRILNRFYTHTKEDLLTCVRHDT